MDLITVSNFFMCGMQVLRMFHRKIHPESSIAAREFVESHKYKAKNAPGDGGCNNGDMMHLGEDNRGFTLRSMSNMGIQYCKTNLNPPEDGRYRRNMNAKEHWIKTDADCKYHFICSTIMNFFIKIPPYLTFNNRTSNKSFITCKCD